MVGLLVVALPAIKTHQPPEVHLVVPLVVNLQMVEVVLQVLTLVLAAAVVEEIQVQVTNQVVMVVVGILPSDT